MRINLAVLAVLYVAGVALAFKFSAAFAVFFAFLYIIIVLISAFARKNIDSVPKALYICAFCAGIVLTQHYASSELKTLNLYTDKYVTIHGRICELPDGADSETMRYVVDVRSVECDGEICETEEKLLLSSDEKYNYGDTITAEGFIQELPEKMNSSGFDARLYYKSKGIFFKCYAMKIGLSEEKITDYSLYSLTLSVKDSISKLIDKYTNNDNAAILKAILTGDKSYISDEFDTVLRRSGTKRFFYPAYLHIYLIVLFIGLFSSVLKKKHRDWAVIILLVLYAVCESSHPVFIKGCLLTAFITFFRGREGYVYFLDMLAVTVVAVTVANPLLLYDAGFVISVGASLLISEFYEPVSRYFKGIKSDWARRTVVTGVICTIGLLPLFAYYFNGVSIYTIVTAVIFIPMTLAVIVVSPLLFAMLSIFGAAPVVAQIMSCILWLYIKLPYLIAALPCAYIILPSPSLTITAAYFALIFAYRFGLKKENITAYAFVTISVTLFALTAAGAAAKINTMEINFVNVGQGDGAFIKMPFKNETVLIDGGGGSEYNKDYNPGESIYLPYLESEGVSNVPCAIISHCHKDHIQGIIAAAENLNVEHIYLPASTDEDNEYLAELKEVAEKRGCTLHYVSEDTRLTFDSGLTIDILAPSGTALLSDDENDQSLLVKVTNGENDCMFTGDMTTLSEYNFLKSGRVDEAEILKVAHHGSAYSSREEFIEAVNPEYSVISVGADNAYGHPARQTLERLADSTILRTDENGDIKITADKSEIKSVYTYK
ncbi:MAG: DNA internalization-related competence protein ComEC/Rec2 [Firmicutes bacterium]|nr:DNA internalization-related competence protein ComEC/Rec2 [Bacillota bacterium]